MTITHDPFVLGTISTGTEPVRQSTERIQTFHVKINRGNVATYWAGDGQPESATIDGARDCECWGEARRVSHELLNRISIDSTEVEMVTL